MMTVDGRCVCSACRARTEDIYRMVGVCYNCGTSEVAMVYRVGDRAQALTCPACGNWRSLHPQKLMTPDAACSP